jgi:hypothetical protein
MLKKRSLLDKSQNRKLTVLIDKKLENTHAKFETSPSKYSVTTSLGDDCFEKFCTKGNKLLKMQLCKTTVVHALKDKVQL